jgi:hypothetical protein
VARADHSPRAVAGDPSRVPCGVLCDDVALVRLTDLLHEVASGGRGPAPASVIVLSGDVHHAYLAEASFPGRAPIESAVVQAVCSSIRNPLDRPERRALRAVLSRSAAAVARLLARSAGVRPAAVR